MWAMTKPMPITPVIAMTYFLPTEVRYRSRRKEVRFLVGFTAVPLTGPRGWGARA
jgi:hypothetical protein